MQDPTPKVSLRRQRPPSRKEPERALHLFDLQETPKGIISSEAPVVRNCGSPESALGAHRCGEFRCRRASCMLHATDRRRLFRTHMRGTIHNTKPDTSAQQETQHKIRERHRTPNHAHHWSHEQLCPAAFHVLDSHSEAHRPSSFCAEILPGSLCTQ